MIRFVLVSKPADADIRVSINYNKIKGTWSRLGTDASNVPNTEPTMNISSTVLTSALRHKVSQLLSRISRSTVVVQILHEIGHCLGLQHEHQRANSIGGLKFKRDALIAYVTKELGWTNEEVEQQILKPVESKGHKESYTKFDPKSIMIYPFPAQVLEAGADGKEGAFVIFVVSHAHARQPKAFLRPQKSQLATSRWCRTSITRTRTSAPSLSRTRSKRATISM